MSAGSPVYDLRVLLFRQPHPYILAEPALQLHGFNTHVADLGSFLSCPDGTSILLQRDAHNRLTLQARILQCNSFRRLLGLGFEPTAGPTVVLLLDTAATISALDMSFDNMITSRTGPRTVHATGGQRVDSIDSGTINFVYLSHHSLPLRPLAALDDPDISDSEPPDLVDDYIIDAFTDSDPDDSEPPALVDDIFAYAFCCHQG